MTCCFELFYLTHCFLDFLSLYKMFIELFNPWVDFHHPVLVFIRAIETKNGMYLEAMSMYSSNKISNSIQIVISWKNNCILPGSNPHYIVLYVIKILIRSYIPVCLHKKLMQLQTQSEKPKLLLENVILLTAWNTKKILST